MDNNVKTKQQEDSLNYFREFAQDWKRKADVDSKDKVNVIKQRNDYILRVIDEKCNVDLVLDVGCGTGDLICDIGKKNISAVGVDFSKEMIDISNDNSKKLNLNNVKFECSSIFNFDFGFEKYDVISANGFIEYISYSELDIFLKNAFSSLKKGGSLVISSRNRLFNIFSFNKFTEEEIRDNTLNLLTQEAIIISKNKNIKDLIGFETIPFQKEEIKHNITGVNVSTRYQFTPIQLINLTYGLGFDPIEIFPIHIHGISPELKNNIHSLHANISNLLQTYANNNPSLLLQSSSFMIHLKKR